MTTVYEGSAGKNPRLLLFFPVVVLAFMVLAGGLFFRQVIEAEKYAEQEKQLTQRRILIPGPRGNIFDREGRLLVGNRPRFSAVIYLNELRSAFRETFGDQLKAERAANPDTRIPTSRVRALQAKARQAVVQEYRERINTILGTDGEIDADDLERHYRTRLLLPFTVFPSLSLPQYARLVQQLPVSSPVQIRTESIRYYPYESAASQTLGYVSSTIEIPEDSVPGDDLRTFRSKGKRGRSGIELSYDEHLSGETGGEIWIVDPSGYQDEEPIERIMPVRGKDLRLTLDIDLQLEAEDALFDRTGAVVALDVATGEVLAIASKPDYNLADFTPFLPSRVAQDIQEREAWVNRAYQLPYAPGSTFKVVTAIALLEHGIIDADTQSVCTGSHMIGNRRFPCWNRAGHGRVNLRSALEGSCNVYFYEHAQRLGIRNLAATANRFHLEQATGIELPYEASSTVVPTPEWKVGRGFGNWQPGDTANTAIGQGYLLQTPLQMACFTASLARRETQTRPTIIRRPEEGLGPRDHGGQPLPISNRDYAEILAGMKLAAERGTARRAAVRGIALAAKTGSAQFRARNESITLAWLIAFAPADNPEIAIAVMVEGANPDDGVGGGLTAAPIAREVLSLYFAKQGRRPAVE